MGNGSIRRVDELGRVVLPIEMRRALDIGERDLVEVAMEGERIVIKKTTAKCVFCGRDHELLSFRGRCICELCRAALCEEED